MLLEIKSNYPKYPEDWRINRLNMLYHMFDTCDIQNKALTLYEVRAYLVAHWTLSGACQRDTNEYYIRSILCGSQVGLSNTIMAGLRQLRSEGLIDLNIVYMSGKNTGTGKKVSTVTITVKEI
jgi:hypothetical protein